MLKKNKQGKEAAATQGLTPFQIGKSGTVDEFRAANKKALDNKDRYDVYFGTEDQRELQRGALAGFKEGCVENLQTMLANPEEFKVIGRYGTTTAVDCEKTLASLMEGSDHQTALVALAIDKVPEDKKQSYLNDILYRAVSSHYYGDDLVSALLDAGANASANYDGFKGTILAKAIESSCPLSAVQLLHEKGASFVDALFCMEANKWDEADIKSLKAYREKVTGEPADDNAELREMIKELQQQMKELTRKIDGPKSGATATPVRQTGKPRAPLQGG